MTFQMFKTVAGMVATLIFVFMVKLGVAPMLLPALLAVIGLAALERWARRDYERKHAGRSGADTGSSGLYGRSDTNGGWSAGAGASGSWVDASGDSWGDGGDGGGDGGGD